MPISFHHLEWQKIPMVVFFSCLAKDNMLFLESIFRNVVSFSALES